MTRKSVDDEAVTEVEVTVFERLRKSAKTPEPLVVSENITLHCPTSRQVRDSQKAANEEEANRVLIGDRYDELFDLFLDEPPHVWAEFLQYYIDHFFDIRQEQSK
jgi:hypothetical protein